MSETQLYLYLVLAGLLISLLAATVFFWHTARKMKKEVLVEMVLPMGLPMGLPSSTREPHVTVHGSVQPVKDEQHEAGLYYSHACVG